MRPRRGSLHTRRRAGTAGPFLRSSLLQESPIRRRDRPSHFFVRDIRAIPKSSSIRQAEVPPCAPHQLLIVAARPPLHHQPHQPRNHAGLKAGLLRQLRPRDVCALPYRATVAHRYCGAPLGNNFCKNSLSAAIGLKRSKSTSSFHCLSKSFGLSALALANSSSDPVLSPVT